MIRHLAGVLVNVILLGTMLFVPFLVLGTYMQKRFPRASKGILWVGGSIILIGGAALTLVTLCAGAISLLR